MVDRLVDWFYRSLRLWPRRSGSPDITVTGSKDSCSGTSTAIGQLYGNTINIFNRSSSTDPMLFGRSSSDPKPNPDPMPFRATLVYSDDDIDEVNGLRSILQGLQLSNGKRVRVDLEEEIVPDGATEVEAYNQCLLNSGLLLLFITENFMCRQDIWKGNVALTESFQYGKNVIPIFTENKDQATYLEEYPTLKSVRGINYHMCKWSEKTKNVFLKNFNFIEEQQVGARQGACT